MYHQIKSVINSFVVIGSIKMWVQYIYIGHPTGSGQLPGSVTGMPYSALLSINSQTDLTSQQLCCSPSRRTHMRCCGRAASLDSGEFLPANVAGRRTWASPSAGQKPPRSLKSGSYRHSSVTMRRRCRGSCTPPT